MRPELLDILCCPHCRGELECETFDRDGEDVIEGLLVCARCARGYPIAEGIPHMLPNALAEVAGFARRHHDSIERRTTPPSHDEIRRFERLHRRTASAFGYEWNRYKVTSREEDLLTLAFLTGLDPALYRSLEWSDVFAQEPSADDVAQIDTSFLRGKRVLEVGCGMGKYVRTVADHGGIAVGLDLSHSLDRARREHGRRSDLHWVRGNILEHPFKEGVFDFVYSVGVLHHTPDCHRAFLNSASLVTEGGHLAVWLYPTERMNTPYARRVHWVQDSLMRPVTSRLPHALLYRLCRVLGAWTFKRDEAARRGRNRLARFYALFAVGAHSDPEIAAFLNFDWYSPQYRSYHSEDELMGWFREARFGDVRVLPQRTSGAGRRLAADESLPPPAPVRIRANLELPGESPLRAGEPFRVGGWAFEESGRSAIVRVYLDDRLVATTAGFDPRLDVKAAFPDVEHALYTGFHVSVPAPSRADSLRLRVTVATEDAPDEVTRFERDLKVEGAGWGRWIVRSVAAILPSALRRRLAGSERIRRLTGAGPPD